MPPKPTTVLKPRGGLVTTNQVECWRQRLKTEAKISGAHMNEGDFHLIFLYLINLLKMIFSI